MPRPAKTADDRVRQAVARVFARRERHRRRPLPVRVAVAVAGFLLLAFGIVALVLPDVGLPAVVAGLALLALEFDWAARLFAVAVLLVERIRRKFVSLPAAVRVAAIAIPVLIVMAVVLALLRVLPI